MSGTAPHIAARLVEILGMDVGDFPTIPTKFLISFPINFQFHPMVSNRPFNMVSTPPENGKYTHLSRYLCTRQQGTIP